MPRYVPKTYNNRRTLRIIVGTVITLAVSTVVLFLVLFFVFNRYFVDGQYVIPWLMEETNIAPPSESDVSVEEDGTPLEEADIDEDNGEHPEDETAPDD